MVTPPLPTVNTPPETAPTWMPPKLRPVIEMLCTVDPLAPLRLVMLVPSLELTLFIEIELFAFMKVVVTMGWLGVDALVLPSLT